VSGCTSYDIRAGRPREIDGSGALKFESLTSVQITWNPPFEGSTKRKPAVTLIQGSLQTHSGGSCPVSTQEFNLTGTVIRSTGRDGDLGGTTAAEVCVDFATADVSGAPGSVVTFFSPSSS
jgi:hypothetical protein